MFGWRTMTLKVGKKGLSEDDFTTRSGGEDDGEKNGANTIRKVRALAKVGPSPLTMGLRQRQVGKSRLTRHKG